MITYSTISCGIKQLSGLGVAPKRLIRETQNAHNMENPIGGFATIIFSDTTPGVGRNTGSTFAQFIRDNKLGGITKSRPVINPNTTNLIQTWIWNINWTAVDKFLP